MNGVQLFLNAERNETNILERNGERNERQIFAERWSERHVKKFVQKCKIIVNFRGHP